jgi:hypothetical protein
MSLLLEEVSRDYFPHPPATPEEIAEFEQRVGWRLDPDLQTIYLHCNGAEGTRRHFQAATLGSSKFPRFSVLIDTEPQGAERPPISGKRS